MAIPPTNLPNFSLLLFSFRSKTCLLLTPRCRPSTCAKCVGCAVIFFFYLFISFFGSDPPRANSRGEAESLTGGESALDFGRANRTRRKKDPSLHPCSRNSEVIWIKASFIHTLSGHAQFSSLAFYNGHIRL